jgi:hypothetical protein
VIEAGGYRDDDLDVQTTTDTNGGRNVGNVASGAFGMLRRVPAVREPWGRFSFPTCPACSSP